MSYLLIVSLIWAFSFGLIKDKLAGLDAAFIAAARLMIALLVFLPFLRIKTLPRKQTVLLILVGAVQYGLMYITYNYSFRMLQAYEVALFTIFTPLYVTLIHDASRRKMHWVSLLTAVLTVAGTAIIKGGSVVAPGWLAGFLIVQVSNLCFAAGQIWYKKIMENLPQKEHPDAQVFGLLYLGGFLSAAAAAALFTPWKQFTIHPGQVLVLLYLGGIASGLCFFLWNVGARKVNAGALAILNNLKIPLAVAVSLLVFAEKAELHSLVLGGLLMLGALFINQWSVNRR